MSQYWTAQHTGKCMYNNRKEAVIGWNNIYNSLYIKVWNFVVAKFVFLKNYSAEQLKYCIVLWPC